MNDVSGAPAPGADGYVAQSGAATMCATEPGCRVSGRRHQTNWTWISTLTTAAHMHHNDVSPSACTIASASTAIAFATPNQTTARKPERSGAPQVATM